MHSSTHKHHVTKLKYISFKDFVQRLFLYCPLLADSDITATSIIGAAHNQHSLFVCVNKAVAICVICFLA